MGSGFTVKCEQCGFEKPFRLGIGFRYSPESVFYGKAAKPNWSTSFRDYDYEGREPLIASLIKDPALREEALNLIRNGGLPDTDIHAYGHEIYSCQHCKGLNEEFYFRITTEEEIFEPKYKCPTCGHSQICLHIGKGGKVDSRKIGELACPSCGKKLSTCGHLRWD